MVTKRGGLGRNLDSLIPTPIRAPGVAQPVAGRLEVSLENIRPNRRQPRSVFDDEALKELAASIREIGILQPPVVRRDRKSTRLNSSHVSESRMPSSA